MTCVAGGLKLTHPSVLPFIKQLVSNSFETTTIASITTLRTANLYWTVSLQRLNNNNIESIALILRFLPMLHRSAQWIAFEDSRGSSLRGLFKKFLEPNDLHLECHLQLARRALLNGPYDALVLWISECLFSIDPSNTRAISSMGIYQLENFTSENVRLTSFVVL